ncbi:MAG: IS1634 family transposase [Chitinophagales bacterium]
MYFKVSYRKNPETGNPSGYYRLVESYRNEYDLICHRTILNVGFIDPIEPEQLNKIQKQLTLRAEGKIELFVEETDALVNDQIKLLWNRLIGEKRIDHPEVAKAKRKRMVDVDTIRHRDVKEIGSEWMAYQALKQLGIEELLLSLHWDKEQVQLATTQIVSRAVYPASELETSRWIKENSAICEITQYPIDKITKDKLYQSAHSLYGVKDELEQHLSKRTNELFDLDDKIILYDLTNTYFEGRMQDSKLAKFGRSKEKRNDAKLIVLALVINLEGFIKYSNVFEGNMADSKTLIDIVGNLRIKTSETEKRAVVVIDAGIATEDNLELLVAKGYDYVCISRSKLKDYALCEGSVTHKVLTKNKEELELKRVHNPSHSDYYLQVKSPGKMAKESGMKTQFETRFEQALTTIQTSLVQKNRVKKVDKINQRIGRAIQKYPSVAQYYQIELTNEEDTVKEMKWQKDEEKHKQMEQNLGVYFIRTNLPIEDEKTVWKIYNTIREIEYSFRTLKTDLDLRPIYHKTDEAAIAHLHLGILAYWLVNTIRYQLKSKEIAHCWKEIVRIGNTQKAITSTAQNQEDEIIIIRRCSEPKEKLVALYSALHYKPFPFTKLKSVVHKSEFQKNDSLKILRI